MISRRKTRVALVEALYADVYVSDLDISLFWETYQDENNFQTEDLDEKYFSFLREEIHKNSSFLLAIIMRIASKFEIEKMPKIHLIILMIALGEIYFWNNEDIHLKVSINEAVELAKIFSDDAGRKFISGVLGTFSLQQEKYKNLEPINYNFFL